MEHNEAVAALESLPAVVRISVAELKPGDTLVIETDAPISVEISERIKTTMGQIWPGCKVAVLSKGMTLKVVSADPVKGAKD